MDIHTYTTVFAETCHVCTRTEIHFAHDCLYYTQEPSMHSVFTDLCELVSFSGGHFADLVKLWLRQWWL